jgi:hypothetical protein
MPLQPSLPTPTIRAERLQRIAEILGAKRYLEVGVETGKTFFALNIEHKIGVDPVFQFKLPNGPPPGHELHDLESDHFFQRFRGDAFDLIFLDGLHTYEQTLRDFLNSLEPSHARTVWVIDDTVPYDEAAAGPDQWAAFEQQRSIGTPVLTWMGDVYRVPYFVRRMMPNWTVMTFEGHGMTVLWRKPQRPVDVRRRTTRDPATLTYAQFVETGAEVLNVRSERDIYDALLADFGPKRTNEA